MRISLFWFLMLEEGLRINIDFNFIAISVDCNLTVVRLIVVFKFATQQRIIRFIKESCHCRVHE